MKARKITPSLESLEGRELLSALAIQPLQHQPRRRLAQPPAAFGFGAKTQAPQTLTASAMSAYGYVPPPPPPPSQLDFGASVYSPSVTSIGGGANITVIDGNPNWKMIHITYEVAGSLISQSFDSELGAYTRFSGMGRNFPNGTDFDVLNLRWDENPGMRTVKVTATYNDPGGTTLTSTSTVMVNKPDVESMALVSVPMSMGHPFGKDRDRKYGITTLDSESGPGMVFDAQINSTPSAGEFAIVQTMSSLSAKTTYLYGTREHKLPAGGPFLDLSADGDTEPALMDLWTGVSPTPGVPDTIGPRYDSPSYSTPDITPQMLLDDVATSLVLNASFDTYLVWHPTGGGYVSVSHIAWTLQAHATYAGPLFGDDLYADYTDEHNWVLTSNHEDAWFQLGDGAVQLLTWNHNVPEMLYETYTPIP